MLADEDYILQFVPPFQRLELLKAQSCPDAIAQHVEQLITRDWFIHLCHQVRILKGTLWTLLIFSYMQLTRRTEQHEFHAASETIDSIFRWAYRWS